MPRQMPTTPGPRIRAQARGGSLLLTCPIGGRGSRHRRPLPDRPPTLQAFRSVLSETTSVSTRRLIKGSRSYLRRHGVQSRGAAISYHKVALAVYRKFLPADGASGFLCTRTRQRWESRSFGGWRSSCCILQNSKTPRSESKGEKPFLLSLLFYMLKTNPKTWKYGERKRTDDERIRHPPMSAHRQSHSARQGGRRCRCNCLQSTRHHVAPCGCARRRRT